MKAVINEKIGDGVMSVIDFRMNIENLEDKGDKGQDKRWTEVSSMQQVVS